MRAYVVAVIAVLASCSSDSSKSCSAGQMECVTDQIARVCASDNTWTSSPCYSGSTCMGGSCVASQNVTCLATDSACMDATHALVCNANGVGFTSVDCPTATTCQGFGLCVGTCIVGSSRCKNTNVVQTCSDGFTYMDANCMPGMTSCVLTSAATAPVSSAACMP